MILNISRARTFHQCKRRAFNYSHRRLSGTRSMNLVDGGAFHAGVAAGRATHDWKIAREVAAVQFAEDVKKSDIPPEQLYLIEQHRELTEAMIRCFEEQYEHEVYQIVQPECVFDVVLPQSGHNCIFMHWVDSDDTIHINTPPSAEDILSHNVHTAHPYGDDPECACWQPHRFVGKTDAVVSWNGNLWLDEYKTTSIEGSQFWEQWQMDVQPTGYIYGIWKSLGIRPRGFLLNSIFKPSEKQVESWNKRRTVSAPREVKDYIRYSREAFLRTEEDLARFERWMLQTCIEWEREIVNPHTPFLYNPSSHTCMSYNRKCDYWSSCLSHEEPHELESLTPRGEYDYVEEKLYHIEQAKA